MGTAPEIKDAAPGARQADKKGFIPALSVLPAIAPIAVAAVAIAPIMAPILTDTDGNAGFASIDSDAASAADAITTPRVAMPTMARAVATMDHFHSAAGIL